MHLHTAVSWQLSGDQTTTKPRSCVLQCHTWQNQNTHKLQVVQLGNATNLIKYGYQLEQQP